MKTKITAFLALVALACHPVTAGAAGPLTQTWQKSLVATYDDDKILVDVFALLSSRGSVFAQYFQLDHGTGETKVCWSDELTLTQSFSLQNPGAEVRFTPKGGDCESAEIVVVCHGVESSRVYTGEATSVGKAGGGVAHTKAQWWYGAECSISGNGAEYITTEAYSNLDEQVGSDKFGR